MIATKTIDILTSNIKFVFWVNNLRQSGTAVSAMDIEAIIQWSYFDIAYFCLQNENSGRMQKYCVHRMWICFFPRNNAHHEKKDH